MNLTQQQSNTDIQLMQWYSFTYTTVAKKSDDSHQRWMFRLEKCT